MFLAIVFKKSFELVYLLVFSKAFFVTKEDMVEAMNRFPNLENNLWRVCGVRMAVPLLLEVPTYYNWTKDKIRIMCERSHIASLPKPPNVVFKIKDHMKEVCSSHWIMLDPRHLRYRAIRLVCNAAQYVW